MDNANSTVARAACQEAKLKADKSLLNTQLERAILLAADADNSPEISLHGLRQAIKNAQSAWASYAQQECGLEDSLILGSGIASGAPACLANRTEARIKELQVFNKSLDDTIRSFAESSAKP